MSSIRNWGVFNLFSARHGRSTPDRIRPMRAARVALTFGVTSALWVGATVAPGNAIAGAMDDVRARGRLICGVSEGLPGFSEKDNSGVWRGFDVDFCKDVAVAALGDTARAEYLPLSADARFAAFSDRRIDLLSRNSPWTMSRDLELGLELAGINYFDGQRFLVPALFGATRPLDLNGAKICVISGTTSESNAAAFFRKSNLKVP